MIRPSQHPNRFEVLMVLAADRFSDEIYSAHIIRHDGEPPTLEKWERVDSDPALTIGGRMVDPLRRALRPQG
jgi:hypothetical protein